MAKLIRILLLCLIPVLLLVYLFPIEQERKYASLELDCSNRGVWIYDRLYQNKRPIDLAFLGSSHTINSISENSIQQSANCDQLSIVNLGYCRMGRNMSYVLLKELLANKTVKSIVVEVREDEDRYSHPVFPFLANSADVLGASLLYNRNYFVDNWQHIAYRCELIQESLFEDAIPKVKKHSDYGFMANADTLSIEQVAKITTNQNIKTPKQGKLVTDFYARYPKSYLAKIAKLCKDDQVALHFLYLPRYGSKHPRPREAVEYASYGTLILPPDTLLRDKNNWHDKDHFNRSGAHRLSNWLGTQLKCDGRF